MSPSGHRTHRAIGSISTPAGIAQHLASWAVQDPLDRVLDLGIGEGVFVFAAYHRLLELGAGATDAQLQVYGAEIDHGTYDSFSRRANDLNRAFPNSRKGDFFEMSLPLVEAVVGNPPYVRRSQIEDLDRIRQLVITRNQGIKELALSRMTDLSVYFLLYALAHLKPGGRVAVITTDSWLDANYGRGFKDYLLRNFEIERLVRFDRRVFHDAEVRPILTLATRKATLDPRHATRFVRLKDSGSIRNPGYSANTRNPHTRHIASVEIPSSELSPRDLWGIYFKAPLVYERLTSHRSMTALAELGETRIGVQTLAKEFFVLSAEEATRARLEREYLEPLAHSVRYCNEPTIQPGKRAQFYLFYCSEGKESLRGTRALEYVLSAESTEVQLRGKGTTVVGYQNKERIKKAGRRPWYDLRTAVESRGRAPILVPRLIYRNYMVVWNKAEFVPGELFIEFLPFGGAELEVYLAILTSSVTELALRSRAQLYGGGTYNIRPGQIKKVPVLNVNALGQHHKADLKQAYLRYLVDRAHDRSELDGVVYDILGFGNARRQELNSALEDMIRMTSETRRATI